MLLLLLLLPTYIYPRHMEQLWRWLQSRGDEVGCTVPMPLQAGKKRPALRHSGKATYGWPECEAYVRQNPGHTEWGVLLDGLCVVDCDSAAAVEAVEALGARDAEVGAALARCAVQETSKGRHYVFYRPRFCDEEGYYDGARQTGVAIADAPASNSSSMRGASFIVGELGT